MVMHMWVVSTLLYGYSKAYDARACVAERWPVPGPCEGPRRLTRRPEPNYAPDPASANNPIGIAQVSHAAAAAAEWKRRRGAAACNKDEGA